MSERRLEALLARHGELELALHEEMKRPAPNLATVRGLKRRKLRVRDEIAALERILEPA